MSRTPMLLLVAISVVVPGGAASQCAIDGIESGIRAYRDLDLENAEALLRDAVEANRRTAFACAAEDARALMYLGASEWLLEQPDSANRSFEHAVIEAPRFQPDDFEFPPDITQAFDEVRRRTPSVAVSMPEKVEIGPKGEESLVVRAVASTDHWITANVRRLDGEAVRPLYRGPIPNGTQGLAIEWDGRDSAGAPVRTGSYELEIVSEDHVSHPVRKLVIGLSIESDAPAESLTADDTITIAAVVAAQPEENGVWQGVAAAGAGLLGGALIAAVPPLIHGMPESNARYVVAGSVSLAGIVGLARSLWGGRSGERRLVPDNAPAPAPDEGDVDEPTVRILIASQRRVELADQTPTRSGGSPPVGN